MFELWGAHKTPTSTNNEFQYEITYTSYTIIWLREINFGIKTTIMCCDAFFLTLMKCLLY